MPKSKEFPLAHYAIRSSSWKANDIEIKKAMTEQGCLPNFKVKYMKAFFGSPLWVTDREERSVWAWKIRLNPLFSLDENLSLNSDKPVFAFITEKNEDRWYVYGKGEVVMAAILLHLEYFSTVLGDTHYPALYAPSYTQLEMDAAEEALNADEKKIIA